MEKSEDYSIFENQNALPLLYATKHFIFYDDISTLKYAFQLVNFSDLPAFLGDGGRNNEFVVPMSVERDKYELNALAISDENKDNNLTLVVANDRNSREITLKKTTKIGNVDVFSTIDQLSPGDTVRVPESETQKYTDHVAEVILNSTSFPIGGYDSFTLNFTTNILQNGKLSFLGPRVLLDTGTEKYFIIIHDDGLLELATQQNGVFNSAVMTRFVGYKLDKPSSFVNVSITRAFDEVQIYLNGEPAFSFPIEAQAATVSLASEQSTSKFSNIAITKQRILRLFAERQISSNPTFVVQKNSPEESDLAVTSGGSNFVVVSQYLYTQLKKVENHADVIEVRANVFFKGWILNSTSLLEEESINIGTEGEQITTGLTVFSIISTYLMLMLTVAPIRNRVVSILLKRLKIHSKEQSGKETYA